MLVAEATIAAGRKSETPAHFGQVANQGFITFLENLRSGGNLENAICAFGAGPVAAHAVNPGLGPEMLLVPIVDQRVETIDRLHPNVTAAAAITAVRPAELDEFFAPKRYGPRAAVARADIDFC